MLATIIRLRYWIAAVVAGAVAVFDVGSGLNLSDLSIFLKAADRMLSEHWVDTFSDPRVQVGPLYVLFIGLADLVGRSFGTIELVIGVITQVGVVLATMWFVRARARDDVPWVEAAAGLAVLAMGVAWLSYISGHLEDIIVGFLWLGAAMAARRDEGGRAGVLLGLAGAVKLTGFLGAPILLLSSSRKERFLVASIAGSAAIVAYGVFILFGDFNMHDFSWPIGSPLIEPFVEGKFSWAHRALQATAVLVIGAIVASKLRATHHSEWAVPLVLVTTRIAIDPNPIDYYWLAYELLVLFAVIDIARERSWRIGVPVGVICYAVVLARYVPIEIVLATRTSVAIGLVLLVWRSGSDSDPAPGAVAGAVG